MAERGLLQGVADEGGWWPAFSSNEEALDTLMLAIERAGFAPGADAAISLDVAASEFGRDGRYRLGLEKRELDRDGLAEMLVDWCARYPIVSIEDPFAEDDAEGFQRFTAAVGERIQMIGDDLLVTNAKRVSEAARRRSANTVSIKVNQAGTVSDAKAASTKAGAPGWARSSRRAQEKPKTRRSFTSRSAGARASSKSAPSPDRNAWPNGTRRSGSRRRWGPRRASPRWTRCPRPEWAGAMARDSARGGAHEEFEPDRHWRTPGLSWLLADRLAHRGRGARSVFLVEAVQNRRLTFS